MKNWVTVFLYELRQKLRSKGYLFITFGVPLLVIAAFFGYQAVRDISSGDKQDKPASSIANEVKSSKSKVYGYVDLTPQHLFPSPESYGMEPTACNLPDNAQTLTASMIKRITAPYCQHNQMRAFDTFAEGKKALDDGDIEALYVFEADYADTGNVSLYLSGFSIDTASSSESVLDEFVLATLLYNVEPDAYEPLYLRLRDPAVISDHKIAASGETQTTNDNQNFVLVYGFGLLIMLGILWGGGYLMQSVVQEKESRIIEIVLSSVAPTPLLLGKILAMGVVALIQVLALVGTFVFLGSQAGDVFSSLGNIDIEPMRIVIMMVYFVLGFLLFGSLMAAIGAVSTSVRESQNFVVVVTMPAMVPFFFLSFFAEEPNSSMATIMSIFPITAPLSMIMRTAVTDVPASQLALSVALLVVTVMGTIWLAGRLFRVNTLLMGNMPKLRDIPRLLRG